MRGSPEDPLDRDGDGAGEKTSAAFRVERFEVGMEEGRVDTFLSRQLGVTRAFVQKLIKEGRVQGVLPARSPFSSPRMKSPKIKPSRGIARGEAFIVKIPPPESLEIEPEDVPFEVVYEDRWLLVVNKPAGLVVHPAPGHWRGTLVHGLLWRYPGMGPFNNVRRPGIVHRLDATTSGLMLVAREQKTMELLQMDLKERLVEKHYLALVHGNFGRPEGVLDGPIDRHPQNRLKMAVVEGGRPSTTTYRVLWRRPGYALVLCGLLTGRTHQIRVHLSAAGHPIVGDALYGATATPGFDRVFLHSWRTAFTHPITREALRFTCPLPGELRERLRKMREE